LPFARLPTGRFVWGYKYPIPWLFSTKVSRAKFSIFQQVFKRVFVPKDLFFICFLKVWKNQEKRSLWDWFLMFISIAILEVFPRVFLCDFDFQTLCFFSHLSNLSILSIRIYFVGKLVCGC